VGSLLNMDTFSILRQLRTRQQSGEITQDQYDQVMALPRARSRMTSTIRLSALCQSLCEVIWRARAPFCCTLEGSVNAVLQLEYSRGR